MEHFKTKWLLTCHLQISQLSHYYLGANCFNTAREQPRDQLLYFCVVNKRIHSNTKVKLTVVWKTTRLAAGVVRRSPAHRRCSQSAQLLSANGASPRS